MGAKDRANPMSDVNRARLGAFNVTVRIIDVNGSVEVINARTWKHAGDYLALDVREDLSKDEIKVICLKNVYSFSVTPQEENVNKIVT